MEVNPVRSNPANNKEILRYAQEDRKFRGQEARKIGWQKRNMSLRGGIIPLSLWERKRAEAGVNGLTCGQQDKQVHETLLNASEQDRG